MDIQNKQIELSRDQLVNNISKKSSLTSILYSIVRFIAIIIQNIYCVSSYLILSWILLYPISLFRSDLYSKIENQLYNSLLFIVASWSLAAEITVVETGDDYKRLIEDENSVNKKQFFGTTKQINGHSRQDILKNSKNNKVLSLHENKLDCIVESVDDLSKGNQLNKNTYPNQTKTKNICNNNIVNTNVGLGIFNPTTQVKRPRILLLCNHVSTADVPMLMQSFSTLKNQSLLWVLDAQVSKL